MSIPRLANNLRGGQLSRVLELHRDAQGAVTAYSCGPTVYDAAHLGHARTYVSLDVVRRVLRRRLGVPLRLAMGVTDVDDKILARAAELGVDAAQFAREQEAGFFADMAALGVQPPDVLLRVTEHIRDITAYVARILEQGMAYEAPGGVYFDTRAFGPRYGAQLAPGRASLEAAEPEGPKRAAADFALWKVDPEAALTWDSPWGRGRPGWHIECSAMAHAVFGDSLGLHTGGIDLLFPHHTNEVAQCDAHRGGGGDWCSAFAHTGHLHIDGRKMSKSLKNFITVRELLASGVSADEFRWFTVLHRYSANVTWSDDRVADARAVDAQFREFAALARAAEERRGGARRWGAAELELAAALSRAETRVAAALAEDVDTPTAVAEAQALARAVKAYASSAPEPLAGELVGAARRFVEELLLDLGFGFPVPSGVSSGGGDDEAIQAAVDFRGAVRGLARASFKDAPDLAKQLLALCDDFRDSALPAAGVVLKDGASGGGQWHRS